MALASNALATVADARGYMRLTTTSDDRLIERLINAVSDRMEKICGRAFVQATYREWANANCNEAIKLKNWPVSAVKRVAYGSATGLTVQASTSTDLRATVEVQDDKLVLSRYDSNGTEASTSLAFATYPTTSGLATQVTATTGWTGTVATNVLSNDLHRLGGQDALARNVSLTYADTSDLEYRVEETAGLVWLVSTNGFEIGWDGASSFPHGAQSVLIEYTAGYIAHGGTTATTIPDNLQQLCIEMVQRAFRMGEHDPNLTSESLDAYSYSLANQVEVDDVLRDQLAYWRDYR